MMLWCCCHAAPEQGRPAEVEEGEVLFGDTQTGGLGRPVVRPESGEEQMVIGREQLSTSTTLLESRRTRTVEEEKKMRCRPPTTPGMAKVDEEEVADGGTDEEGGDGPFSITLEMTPGERLGALLDILDMKTLRVVELRREGRLRVHNARAKGRHLRVLPGYFIVEVNGVSGSAQRMVDEMRRSKIWKLQVARNHEFVVKIEKSGPLRMDLQFEKDSDCIVIRKIGDIGVVKEYNDSTTDREQQLRPGDRILDVNDTAGPASALLETIKNSTDLNLKIGRPLI